MTVRDNLVTYEQFLAKRFPGNPVADMFTDDDPEFLFHGKSGLIKQMAEEQGIPFVDCPVGAFDIRDLLGLPTTEK